ncbi:MAG: HisA/HisF-related TIM barrel protein, partial [Planctomycetia bacterium]
PAIKPIALRCVHQVRQKLTIPIVGVGGIMTIDDCMEFFVAGASAVQLGTASFAEPIVSMRILDALPGALAELGAASMKDVIGTLALPNRQPCGHPAGATPHAH